MLELRSAGTSELDAATLARIHTFLDQAFAGDFSDVDWAHALGGKHVLALEEELLVAHVALVPRGMVHQGRSLRTGYVEALGVSPDWRRRGVGRAVMRRLEAELPGAYDLGALSATDDGARFYRALGWTHWEGSTSVLAPEGRVLTPEDDGSVFVRPLTVPLDLRGELTCDWRPGDVW